MVSPRKIKSIGAFSLIVVMLLSTFSIVWGSNQPLPNQEFTSQTGTAQTESTPALDLQTGETIHLDVRIKDGEDDAEESSDGSMSLSSSDLELVYDGDNQTVGLRFQAVSIPPGAQVVSAYIQFETDETNSEATSLTIQGEAADQSAPFTSTSRNLSSRERTNASVAWSPAAWLVVGEAGPDQCTPDIREIIQEIVNRYGWESGNPLTILFHGAGHRTARAYESDPASAPKLHIEYNAYPGNSAPQVSILSPRNNTTYLQNSNLSLQASAIDRQDGDLTASLVWTSSLDGEIGTGGSLTITNLSPGTHTIVASVTDRGSLLSYGARTITIFPEESMMIGAGDIADCGNGSDAITAAMLDQLGGHIFTAGDNTNMETATEGDYLNCFDPNWGRHIARIRPVPGNHDYHEPGASAYYAYFGASAGNPGEGYYSYDVGAWHILALNSNIDISAGAPELQWLSADLEAHPNECTFAYIHRPRFSSGVEHGSDTDLIPIWQILYEHGVDIIVNGHEHVYERFAPQDPYGAANFDYGIREITSGTGGALVGAYEFKKQPEPNSEVRDNATYGLLKLTLNDTSYAWQFIPEPGATFTDSGSESCTWPGHPRSEGILSKTPTVTPTPVEISTATYTSMVTITSIPISTHTATITHTPAPSSTSTLASTATASPTKPSALSPDRAFMPTPARQQLADQTKVITSVAWVQPGAPVSGAAGLAQQLSRIELSIQGIIYRYSWMSGNPLVVLTSSVGRSKGAAGNLNVSGAPLLHVAFDPSIRNSAPQDTLILQALPRATSTWIITICWPGLPDD